MKSNKMFSVTLFLRLGDESVVQPASKAARFLKLQNKPPCNSFVY